jgi:hypothetical protein
MVTGWSIRSRGLPLQRAIRRGKILAGWLTVSRLAPTAAGAESTITRNRKVLAALGVPTITGTSAVPLSSRTLVRAGHAAWFELSPCPALANFAIEDEDALLI